MTESESESALSRADLSLIAHLARQPGWFQNMPDRIRADVMGRLVAVLNKDDLRTRELVSVAKAMASLERNDLERGKLLIRVSIEEEED